MTPAARRLPARMVHHAMVSSSQWASVKIMAKVKTSKQQKSMMKAKSTRGSRSASASRAAAIQPKRTNAMPWTAVYSTTRGRLMTSADGSRSPWNMTASRSAGVRNGTPAALSYRRNHTATPAERTVPHEEVDEHAARRERVGDKDRPPSERGDDRMSPPRQDGKESDLEGHERDEHQQQPTRLALRRHDEVGDQYAEEREDHAVEHGVLGDQPRRDDDSRRVA